MYHAQNLNKIVCSNVKDYSDNNNFPSKLQSAQRKSHSTEESLINVHDYFVNYINDKKIEMLLLLDLSAVFDTIDQMLLLNRLREMDFGLQENVLDWFK